MTATAAGYVAVVDDRFTVQRAREAADQDRLGEWIAEFLASDGSDNAELGRELRDEVVEWLGPVRVPFDELHRLAGPPDEPTLDRLDGDDLERVEDMEDSIDDGWQPAPLVATFRDDHLRLEDGNHRIEGLRRAGHEDYWTIVGVFADDERRRALALAVD